jgi:short-subunit dehydrogenase
MFASNADAVERDGLNALASGKAVKISGLMNWVMAQSNRLSPLFAVRKIAGALQKSRGR